MPGTSLMYYQLNETLALFSGLACESVLFFSLLLTTYRPTHQLDQHGSIQQRSAKAANFVPISV